MYLCHSEVVLKFRDLIAKLEKDVEAVMKLEREERELAASEAKVHLDTCITVTKIPVFNLKAKELNCNKQHFYLNHVCVCLCVAECGSEASH